MHDTELELLARQLADGLRGDHDAFCRELVRLLASGHPIAREHLATVLQMTAEQVAEVLAGLADIELDSSGNIVGWGLTFVPTPHRFRVQGQTFYTWCALDALTYPALLQVVASVESSCPVSGAPVTLSITPAGVHDLTPLGFFRSRRDALRWQASSPTARLLSVADAYQVGRLTARYRYPS